VFYTRAIQKGRASMSIMENPLDEPLDKLRVLWGLDTMELVNPKFGKYCPKFPIIDIQFMGFTSGAARKFGKYCPKFPLSISASDDSRRHF
jgi:hypothetical protein